MGTAQKGNIQLSTIQTCLEMSKEESDKKGAPSGYFFTLFIIHMFIMVQRSGIIQCHLNLENSFFQSITILFGCCWVISTD